MQIENKLLLGVFQRHFQGLGCGVVFGETRPVFDRPSSVFKRFDVHATVLKPGIASHPPHTHRAEEIILMTKGSGEILIDKQAHKAAAGDVVLLRANVPHAFTNTGSSPCGYFAIQWHGNEE